LGGKKLPVNDEFAGFTMMYSAIHGEDDKIDSPNKND